MRCRLSSSHGLQQTPDTRLPPVLAHTHRDSLMTSLCCKSIMTMHVSTEHDEGIQLK